MASQATPNGLWELIEFGGKNPVHTAAFLNAFNRRGFSLEEVIAREGIQNSSDAGSDVRGITRVEFHDLEAAQDGKETFMELFSFRELLQDRVSIFESQRNKRFAAELRSFLMPGELNATLIRDFNTTGLSGDWQRYDPQDHFGRLVCALNMDDKSDANPALGGSFGLGKTTYSHSSKVYTVIYHSVFKPSERSKGVSRRLMVASTFPRHQFKGKDYGGFVYFGAPFEEEGECKPFEDDDATEIWSKIAQCFNSDFSRRDSDTGTDVLILHSDLDLSAIRKASEDYYFPAILNNNVDVTFVSKEGELSKPTPHLRQDLDQFTRLWKEADTKSFCKEEDKLCKALNKFNNLNLGVYSFQAAEPDEADSDKSNTVALLKGTGMVINYVKMGTEQYEAAVGVFVADRDVYPYVSFAEDPAHSEWDPDAKRLKEAFPDIGPQVVKALMTRLEASFKRFQESLQPVIKESRTETGLFARLLAEALSGTTGESPVPPGEPVPVARHLTQKARGKWALTLQENEHTGQQPWQLTLTPVVSIAGDARKVAVKHKPFTVTDDAGVVYAQSKGDQIPLIFNPGQTINLNIEFDDPGEFDYIVKFNFQAVRLEVLSDVE